MNMHAVESMERLVPPFFVSRLTFHIARNYYSQDTPMWETPLMDSPGQGSYEFPHADSPPLYAGPDPEQASGCEEDNYLGLPADSAPGATLLGCYPDGWNQPALGFGPATTSTMNTAEVQYRGFWRS